MAQTDRLAGLLGNSAFKVPVRAASTAALTLSGEQTVDGVALVTGNRVLVKDQADGTENGIWVVDTGAWSRAKDFDGTYDVVKGTIVLVTDGATGVRYYRISTENDITIGTTAITFEQALTDDAALIQFLQLGAGAIASNLQGRGRLTVSIYDFMTDAQRADALLAAPVLDHASAMSAAVARIMGTQGSIATRGGAIHIPGGYRIRLATDPFGVLPYDGATTNPTQVPLRIYGDGADEHTTGTIAFKGASVIDFRYATANNAKIDTRGRGVLELDHLAIIDESGNAEAFVHTTNTCVLIHDNLFVGSKTSAWDQDCVILGGTDTVFGTNAADAPFQGYGSQIYNNHFHRIRRAVYARVFANGVPIHHNTVWADCGFTTGAPFDYDGDPLDITAQTIAGMPIHHNLVEMVNYKYGVKCREAVASTLGPNDFYDEGASATASYTFGAGAEFNLVIGGFHSDAVGTFVEETGTGVGKNCWLSSHQSRPSVFTNPVNLRNVDGATGNLISGATFTGGTGQTLIQPAASQSDTAIVLTALRSAAEGTNPGTVILELLQNGQLKIGGTAAGVINFVDAAGTAVASFTSGLKTWAAAGAGGAMKQDSGSGGSYFTMKNFGVKLQDEAGANEIIIKQDTGSPEGTYTAPVGSLYLRTDGGANTTLYIKESGTGNTGWIAK